MATADTTQDRILESIRDRLRDRIDEYNEATCFVSDSPNPLLIPPGDEFCVVSLGAGIFPAEFFVGGGANQLMEDATVVVSPYVQYAIDESGRLEEAILDHNRGILTRAKLRILRALIRDDWEPEYHGSELLRDMIRPTQSSAPELLLTQGGLKFVSLSITFATPFDWEL